MDARKGSRFAPTMTLAELRAGPAPGTRGGGGFGDRGGRGSSRGGRGSSPSNLAELLQRAPALPPTNQLQQQPVTMQQQQPPQQQRQQISNTTHQPAPITSHQQGAKSFADIVAPPAQLEQLEAFGYIPPEVLAVVGIASGTTLPILPKSNAVRYDVGGLPFVTKATRNCDTAGAYLKEETGFKLAALRHATRAVIVRSNVVTDTPYIFLFDIAAAPPAGMVDSCITLRTRTLVTTPVASGGLGLMAYALHSDLIFNAATVRSAWPPIQMKEDEKGVLEQGVTPKQLLREASRHRRGTARVSRSQDKIITHHAVVQRPRDHQETDYRQRGILACARKLSTMQRQIRSVLGARCQQTFHV